jgi:hypothetical protein
MQQYLHIDRDLYVQINKENAIFEPIKLSSLQSSNADITEFLTLTTNASETTEDNYVYAIIVKLSKHLGKSYFIASKRNILNRAAELCYLQADDSLNKKINRKTPNWKSIDIMDNKDIKLWINSIENEPIIIVGRARTGKTLQTPLDVWKNTFVKAPQIDSVCSSSFYEDYVALYPKDARYVWNEVCSENIKTISYTELLKAPMLTEDELTSIQQNFCAFIGTIIENSKIIFYLVSIPPSTGVRKYVPNVSSFLSNSIKSVIHAKSVVKKGNISIRLADGNNIIMMQFVKGKKTLYADKIAKWNECFKFSDRSWVTINPNKTKKTHSVLQNRDLILNDDYSILNGTRQECNLRLHSIIEEAIAQIDGAFALQIEPVKIIESLDYIDNISNNSPAIREYVLFKFFQSHAFRIVSSNSENTEFEHYSCDVDQVCSFSKF